MEVIDAWAVDQRELRVLELGLEAAAIIDNSNVFVQLLSNPLIEDVPAAGSTIVLASRILKDGIARGWESPQRVLIRSKQQTGTKDVFLLDLLARTVAKALECDPCGFSASDALWMAAQCGQRPDHVERVITMLESARSREATVLQQVQLDEALGDAYGFQLHLVKQVLVSQYLTPTTRELGERTQARKLECAMESYKRAIGLALEEQHQDEQVDAIRKKLAAIEL